MSGFYCGLLPTSASIKLPIKCPAAGSRSRTRSSSAAVVLGSKELPRPTLLLLLTEANRRCAATPWVKTRVRSRAGIKPTTSCLVVLRTGTGSTPAGMAASSRIGQFVEVVDAGAFGISTRGSSRLLDHGSNMLGDMAVGWESVESGPPGAERTVLLLPGGMCSARSYAEVMAEPTLAEVRLVAVTMPGHAGAPPPEDFRAEEYASITTELAKDVKADVIVGFKHGRDGGLRDGGFGRVFRPGSVARVQLLPAGRTGGVPSDHSSRFGSRDVAGGYSEEGSGGDGQEGRASAGSRSGAEGGLRAQQPGAICASGCRPT